MTTKKLSQVYKIGKFLLAAKFRLSNNFSLIQKKILSLIALVSIHELSVVLASFFVLLFISPSFAAPTALTYQGRILKSDGTPLTYNNVSFIFQIINPAGSCVIYQEQVTGYNMATSSGVFDVPIGSGSVNFPLGGGFTVVDTFNNTSTFTCGVCSGYTCSNGTGTYAPISSDGRLLRVQFYDGIGWQTITPDSIIRTVPFAGFSSSAERLGTNVAADFLLKAGLPTCGANTFLAWNGTALSCQPVSGAAGGTVTNVSSANSYLSVATGTSTPVITANVGTTANTLAAGNDARITGALQSGAAAGGDLGGTYPSPTLTKISGVALSITSLGVGNFLKYNGTNWINAIPSSADLSDGSSLVKASQMPANCSSNQTLTFSSPTGTWTCSNIAITGSAFGSQTANTIFAAPNGAAGNPTFRALVAADLPVGTLSGSGTAGYLPYYSAASTLANSPLYTSGGNVGIGTTNPGARLSVDDRLSSNAGSISFSSAQLVNHTINGNHISRSGDFFAENKISSGVTNSGSSIGLSAGAVRNSGVTGDAGTLTNIVGIDAQYGHYAWDAVSPMTTNAYGVRITPAVSSGTVTNLYDLYLSSAILTGTVTNRYGLYQADANAKNYFSGNVGIGTTAPAAKLQVGAAPTATANYPLFALGNAPFDGTTAGFYTGNANGTFVGVNAASGYAGDFANFQVNGVTKYKIDNLGNITAGGTTSSTGAISTSGNISTTGTGTITSAGALMASSGTVSTSPTTGSLIVTGGAGVSGALNVGSNIIANGNISTSSGTAATIGANQNSPSIYLTANYWNGTASAVDQWSIQNTLGTGANPTSTMQFGHTGSTGATQYAFMNGNVGIGTTSPVARLEVSDVANSNVIRSSRMGASASDVSLSSQSGVSYVGSMLNNVPFGFLTNNIERMRIDTSGNVGIGTASPGAKLDIRGTTQIGINSVSSSVLVFDPSVTSQGFIRMTTDTSANYIQSGIDATLGSAKDLRIGPSFQTTPWMTLQGSSGNIGVGTTAPAEKLDLGAISTASSTLTQSSSGKVALTGSYWTGLAEAKHRFSLQNIASTTANESGRLGINWDATELMTVNSNGNVGIGTTTPAAKLHINGASATGEGLRLSASASATEGGQITLSDGTGTGGWEIDNQGADGLESFRIFRDKGENNLVSPFIINAAGNIGIGTASPGVKLDVVGTARAGVAEGSNALSLQNNSNGGSWNFRLQGDGTTANNLYLDNTNLGGNALMIKSNGVVGIGTTAPGYKLDVQGGDINASGSVRAAGVALTSDIRFKKNITALENPLNKILALRGVTYDWRRDEFPERHFSDRKQLGVIAQEVEKQFPEAVDTDKNGYKSVSYTSLVSPLIEAVKTLYNRITGIEDQQTTQARQIASIVDQKADNARVQALEKENATKDKKISELEARLNRLEKALNSK